MSSTLAAVLLLASCALGAESLESTVTGVASAPAEPRPASIKDCAFGAEYKDAVPSAFLYGQPGGWKLYTHAHGPLSYGNVTYLCVFENLGIFFPNIVPAETGAVTHEGGILTVRTVSVAADERGRKLLSPASLGKAKTAGRALVFKEKGRRVERSIDWEERYLIRTEGLARAIEAPRNLPFASADVVAWVSVENDDLKVRVHPGEDAARSALEAVARLARGTICADADGRAAPALEAYLKKASADPGLASQLKEFAEEATKSVVARPPAVTLRCLPKGSPGDWQAAYTTWNPNEILTTLDGELDPKSAY